MSALASQRPNGRDQIGGSFLDGYVSAGRVAFKTDTTPRRASIAAEIGALKQKAFCN